jgi:hypothetical protein
VRCCILIARTGNDTGRAAGLEMRAVAPIRACRARRAEADRAVLGEFSMRRCGLFGPTEAPSSSPSCPAASSLLEYSQCCPGRSFGPGRSTSMNGVPQRYAKPYAYMHLGSVKPNPSSALHMLYPCAHASMAQCNVGQQTKLLAHISAHCASCIARINGTPREASCIARRYHLNGSGHRATHCLGPTIDVGPPSRL